MKTPLPQPSPRRAFTLIEVLVVISLIAVLAAISLSGINAVLQRAKKAQALDVCSQLVLALRSYTDEYGALPDLPADLATDSSAGSRMLQELVGESATLPPDAQQPKRICFFRAKEAKGKKDGIEWSGDTPKALWDPWGFPYHVRLDLDYDQRIEDPLRPGTVVRGQIALVYTLGKNQRPDAGARDDVRSW